MESKDRNGQPLKVGDTISVRAVITDIVDAGGEPAIVALTEVPHGTDGRKYSIPVVYGSQVDKA
jgi:hypothetical protein